MRSILKLLSGRSFVAFGRCAAAVSFTMSFTIVAITFAPAASAQSSADAVYAVTYLDVSTDWILQGSGLIKQFRDASRRQAGNLEFTVLQESERPNRFVFGSGWPQAPMRAYREYIASAIPEMYHSQVFEENAQVLFRM